MYQTKEAGPYTITTGLYHSREHIYVTHRETGRQWISKSPTTGKQNIRFLADLIETRITKFDPTKIIRSCDTRFWLPIDRPVPAPRNDFDALCFVGE